MEEPKDEKSAEGDVERQSLHSISSAIGAHNLWKYKNPELANTPLPKALSLRLRNNDGARYTNLEPIKDAEEDDEDPARDVLDHSIDVQVDQIEAAF